MRGRRVGTSNSGVSMLFITTRESAVVGSEIGGAQGAVEHNVRMSNALRNVIDANEFFENQTNTEMVGIRNNGPTPDEFDPSAFVVIGRNSFAPVEVLPIFIGQYNTPGNKGRIEDIWINENNAWGPVGGIPSMAKLFAEDTAASYLNRVVGRFNYWNPTGNLSAAGNQLRMFDVGGNGTKADFYIDNNAMVYVPTPTHSGISNIIDSGGPMISCDNNVIYDKSSTGTLDACSGTSIDAGSVLVTTDPFDFTAGDPGNAPPDYDDLKITASSPLHSTGVPVPILLDVFGNACPQGSMEPGVHCIAD
jgi:hypothetical protein